MLLSDTIRQAVSKALPDSVTLRDLGRHRLRDLLEPELITQLVIAGLPSDFPPLKTLEGHPTNLPTLLTALLGRDDELSSIADLFVADEYAARYPRRPGWSRQDPSCAAGGGRSCRSISRMVSGSSGSGAVSEPHMILPAVAATVGVREGGGLDVREALVHWLGNKRLLFVFDNVEQVIAGTPAIADLLAECPQVRILATSRQRLGIGGERILPVQPLALAPMQATGVEDIAGSAAVRLFAERAREIDPGFELNDRNATIIAGLCARLDGLPLAIELAAAQLRVRTLPELVVDLDRRFDLLVGGKREALTHQQSLEATIDWSYELLDPAAQRLLRLVSVFCWRLEPGRRQSRSRPDVGSVRECMTALSEQSLIRRNVLPDDSSRWSMLESIRAFGRERLQEAGEAEPAQDRHADWCLAFAEEAGSHLDGGEQERWLARLDLEHDNARAALRWAADTSDAKRMLALATALAPYWQTRGYPQRGATLARVGAPGRGSDLIDRVTSHGRGRRAGADPGRPFSGAILVHPGAGRGTGPLKIGDENRRSSTILVRQPWSKAISTRQSAASPMVSSWRRHSAINGAGPMPWRILAPRRITAGTWSLRCNGISSACRSGETSETPAASPTCCSTSCCSWRLSRLSASVLAPPVRRASGCSENLVRRQVRRSLSPGSASLHPGKAIWSSPRHSTPKASNWLGASRIWPPRLEHSAIWP